MVEVEAPIADAKADQIAGVKDAQKADVTDAAHQAKAVDMQDVAAKVAAIQAKAVDTQGVAVKVAAIQVKAVDMQDVAVKVAAIQVKTVDMQDVPHLSRNADTLAKAKAVATKDNSMREVATLKLSKF